jgi:tetratricopeptide (TPR) repeat protein
VRVEKETAEDVLRDAQSCWEAAELVPAAPAYDWLRNDYLDNAAELACLAAATQAGAAGYSARPALAREALAFSRTVLDLDPKDAGGRGHAALARGLAMSGRYDDAVTAANGALERAPEAWRNDPSFCFRYASMLSLDNQLDNVGGWISRAYQDGFTRADSIRSSGDFENFRRARPDEYERLTKAKITYRVDFGIFNDDVIITNISPFTLNKLQAQVTIRKGAQTWTPKIECDSVAAGAVCKGVNVVSIPNDKYDDMDATFTCDNCG